MVGVSAVRLATSVPTETYSRIAVPTLFPLPVTEGRKIVVTYPLKAFGNIKTFDLGIATLSPDEQALFKSEKARIEAM